MSDAMTNIRQHVTLLDDSLNELAERANRQATALARSEERAARLIALLEQAEARLARGTGDHQLDAAAAVAEFDGEPTKPGRRLARGTQPAAPALAAAPPRDLAGELEQTLRSKPHSLSELARALHVPANHVAIALRGLRKAHRIYNVGSPDAPRWTWIIGDDTSVPELARAFEALLRDRPMTFAELLAATGARRGRVSGVIVGLQRSGAGIENRGTERRARWFLPR